MDDVILSIYVPTYNHEKYIARALDSILMQKTDYAYEVLVGEDASTDNTRAILKEYEKKYPGRFQMYYREKNMHKQKVRNAGDLIRRCSGKYIIALEGDDFWTDENKIDEEIRFLETHLDYIAVAHNCVVVGDNSKPNGEEYPECKDEEYTINHYVSEIMPGQLTTVMKRNYRRDNVFDTSLIDKGLIPGDRVQYFTFLCNGKIHCIQKKMSAYRHITNGGDSYSAGAKYSYKNAENMIREAILYAEKKSNKKNATYMEFSYLKNIRAGVKSGQINKKRAIKDFGNLKHKFTAVWLYVRFWINCHIRHKRIWL